MLCHRRSTIPAAWSGSRVLLHFGAVASRASVFVNGKPAGQHEGRWEAFSFDITDLLQPGSNEILVAANNPHEGRSQAPPMPPIASLNGCSCDEPARQAYSQ